MQASTAVQPLPSSFWQRLIRTLLITAAVVFFSEKTYWYPTGYAFFELLLFYGFVVYACLWAIDYFRVQTLAGMTLIAAFYAFLVEGVLTPVMFEGGLLSPIMPLYFIAWHGTLAFLFGWFLVQRWLAHKQWLRVALGSIAYGLLWGAWSLTFWLPEANEPTFPLPGRWEVIDFAGHAFLFTAVLIGAHFLLGVLGRTGRFTPRRGEAIIYGSIFLFFYVAQSFIIVPWGILTLALLFALLYWPLRRLRRATPPETYMRQPAKPSGHILWLLLMPITAVGIYAWADAVEPGNDVLLALLELIPFVQMIGAFVLIVWAWGTVMWQTRSRRAA